MQKVLFLILAIAVTVTLSGCGTIAKSFAKSTLTESNAIVSIVGTQYSFSSHVGIDESLPELRFCNQHWLDKSMKIGFDCTIPEQEREVGFQLLESYMLSILEDNSFIKSSLTEDVRRIPTCLYLMNYKRSYRKLEKIDDCLVIFRPFENYRNWTVFDNESEHLPDFYMLVQMLSPVMHERFHYYFPDSAPHTIALFGELDDVGEEFLAEVMSLQVYYRAKVELGLLANGLQKGPNPSKKATLEVEQLCKADRRTRLRKLREMHPSFLGAFLVNKLVVPNLTQFQSIMPGYIVSILESAKHQKTSLEFLSDEYCELVTKKTRSAFDFLT